MSTLKVTNIQHPSASNPGLQLDTSGVCYQLGMRNLLINGNPLINQRAYVSGTATVGANEYTLDRWRVVTTGQSITFSDSANVRTVTAPAGGVEQVVEGLNLLSGTYTLSWTGTATATVDGNPVTNGGQVTLTGGTDVTVRFINGTFSLAQLERGSVVTPFEHRPYSDELSRCQRYYQLDSYFYLDGDGPISVQFTTEMRAVPAMSVTANVNLSGSATGTVHYTAASDGNTTKAFTVWNVSAGIVGCDWTANAEL
jgi:hypothetical protein